LNSRLPGIKIDGNQFEPWQSDYGKHKFGHAVQW
jgi:hypothetical protein